MKELVEKFRPFLEEMYNLKEKKNMSPKENPSELCPFSVIRIGSDCQAELYYAQDPEKAAEAWLTFYSAQPEYSTENAILIIRGHYSLRTWQAKIEGNKINVWRVPGDPATRVWPV